MNDPKIATVFSDIIKSVSDLCDYRMIRLKNGLEALLVHDPEIFEEENGKFKLSAAAMSVGVGSLDSPIEVQGLAHILEHMVVKGSEKFPEVNEFDRYISIHGGQSHEETHAQHTCYRFEVMPEFLKGALERFSQGIISPLVKEDSLDLEINSLNSEFDLEKNVVESRLQRLQCHSSKPGHPYNKFLSGNKKSLMDATDGSSDLRKKILEFHSNHYHGGKMKLVVIGGESLDVLQSWVVEFFTSVKKDPRKERRKVYLKVPKKAYFRKSFWAAGLHRKLPKKSSIWKPRKIYKQEATSNVHILYLSWTLPCLRKQYLHKPDEYLFHFLEHGGRGSLIALLKAFGWATSLECGVPKEGIYRTSIAYIFVIAIHLTDSGLEKINTIIGFVYQYLKLLRKVSPPKWIFEEIKGIGEMAFRFPEEKLQIDYASKLSENLIFYPPKDVIYADYVYKWDKQLVKQILWYFVPGNMRVDIVSNGLKNKASTCEPWYQIHYSVEAIDQDLMKLWKKTPKVNASLHFPLENKFLTNDFSLRDDGISNSTCPTCMSDEKMNFWYKQSSTFKVPIASIYIRINFKGSCDDINNCTSSELFIHLLNDRLSDVIFQARIAKLETSLSFVDGMLQLKLFGFNEKLPELLYQILSEVNSFMPTHGQYKLWKEDMEKNLMNDGNQLLKTLLCEHIYDKAEKLIYLEEELLFDDLHKFINNLRSQLYIEGLCYGNLTQEEAETICNKVKEIFPGEPLPVASRHVERVVHLPPNENLVMNFKAQSKFDINSVTEIYFQFEQDLTYVATKLMALIDLFDVIVEQPFYKQMRTIEQLGYVVDSLPLRMHGVSGFRFRVISSDYNPDHLQLRIDSFIDQLEGFFNDLDDEAFENYKSVLLVKLLAKDLTVVAESDRLWTQIVEERCKFDLSQKKAEEIKIIEKKDMIEWCKMYLNRSSPKCRRLQVNFWGSKTKKTAISSRPDFQRIAKFKKQHGYLDLDAMLI